MSQPNWRTGLLVIVALGACAEAPVDPLVVENPFAGAWQDAEPPPVRLVLEQTYGGDLELLKGPDFAAGDAEGNLYLVDDDRLLAFRPDGSSRWSVAGRGDGPGELRFVRGIALNGEHIWITNQRGTRLDRFGVDGAFQEGRSLAGFGIRWAALAGVIGDSTVVTSTLLRGRMGNTIRLVSAGSPEILDSLTVDRTGSAEVPENLSLGGEVGVVGEAIAVSLTDAFGYAFFSPSLDTLRLVRRENALYHPPHPFVYNGNSAVLSSGRVDQARPLADGLWLGGGAWSIDTRSPKQRVEDILAGDPSPLELEESVDLYDRHGKLLYAWGGEALEVLGIAAVLATDGERRIYARMTDEVPTVGRYRVEVAGLSGGTDG